MRSPITTKIKAVAYLRTSSAANVGEDKDSHLRQLAAIKDYAKRADYVIELPPYYDAAVSGSDPIESRTGFATMLGYMVDHPDVRVILVENAGRFARDLIVQLTGHDLLKARGIALIPVDAPDYFTEETPTAVLIRQVLGAVSQFEKAMIVSKLRMARDRKRAATGKCEGRKSHAEVNPNAVAIARKLHRKNRDTSKRLSYRKIAASMAKQGHLAASGKVYGPSAIKSMLA
jgi:DNA invertase Pin-like site-specific DNA recombinase